MSANPFTVAKVVGVGVDPEAYHRNPSKRGEVEYVMSRSDLMEFARCPHRWVMGYKEDDADTKATLYGSIIDTLVLDPDRFDGKFAVAPSKYPAKGKKKDDPEVEKDWNRNATYCQEWEAAQGKRVIVKNDLMTQAENAVKLLFGDRQIADFINDSDKQVMVIGEYDDSDTGITVPVKAMIDLVPRLSSAFDRALGDLKTANNAAPIGWGRQCYNFGYHWQAAFYLDLYVAATGDDRNTFQHIIQESFPPWEVGKRILSQELIELGRAGYVTALGRYCQCLKLENIYEWPSYEESGNERMVLNGWSVTDAEAWMV